MNLERTRFRVARTDEVGWRSLNSLVAGGCLSDGASVIGGAAVSSNVPLSQLLESSSSSSSSSMVSDSDDVGPLRDSALVATADDDAVSTANWTGFSS